MGFILTLSEFNYFNSNCLPFHYFFIKINFSVALTLLCLTLQFNVEEIFTSLLLYNGTNTYLYDIQWKNVSLLT